MSDDEEFVYPLTDGSVVIFPANSRYVIVRQCPGAGFDQVHEHAREAANRAIDVYFGQGGRPLLIAHKDSPYIVGWTSPTGHMLRIVGRYQLTSRFRAKVEVRDADGNPVEQPAPPPRVWHESLRYYRIAEATTDLYDSFRNLYLALESLLSTQVPPKSDGEREEGDCDWLKRALRAVGQTIDLTPYAPVSPKSPHNAIHQELYLNLRTAIFHAKEGRKIWTPQDWSARAEIVAARIRYARMFRALAASFQDISYPFGERTAAGWESIWEELARSEVFVSNDARKIEDEPKGDYQLAPAGGAFLKLPTEPAEDMATDWCRGVMGVEVASTAHQALGEIRRFGTLLNDEVAVVENLQAPLIIDGIVELQAVLLLEGRNYGQPRQDFES